MGLFSKIKEKLDAGWRPAFWFWPSRKGKGTVGVGVSIPLGAKKKAPVEGSRAWMFHNMELTNWGFSTSRWYENRILSYLDRYKKVSRQAGVPWQVIGIIHQLECSGSFTKHLHNGDPLWERTKQVPAGRPQSATWTWESSAVDALKYDRLDKVDWSDLEAALTAIEKYNGLGYERKGLPSPYLWSGTNFYTKGKYVRDGVYDPEAVSKQVGAAVLLKQLSWKA